MRARPTNRRLLLANVLAVVVGACALFDPEAHVTFSVVLPGQDVVDPLAVEVIDRTRTVTAVVVGQGNFPEGIEAAPGDPEILIVTWMGGMCDVSTTLTIEPTIDTIRISEAIETRPGECRLAGIMRSVAIRFDPLLAPEFAEFVRA